MRVTSVPDLPFKDSLVASTDSFASVKEQYLSSAR